MSTTKAMPTIADVIKLLNEGGWRLMGGKIARDAYRAEYQEHLPAGVKPKMKNCFFEDPRRIYVDSASLDESGQIVLRVYANRTPVKLDPDEGRVLSAGVLVEPKVEVFNHGLKDYFGARTGTTKFVEIKASFVETAQRKKSEGGGFKEVRQEVLALRFERV